MLVLQKYLAPALTLGLLLAACSGEVNQTSGSASGSGGDGGNGGGSASGSASGGGAAYSAANLFTHVPRFMIFKADPVRDVCFRFWMEGLGSPGPLGINVTMPWGLSKVEVTNHAIDCSVQNGFPMQPLDFADAVSGTGSIVITGGFPCDVSAHGSVSFTVDPTKPWIPATETFDVDALPVDGGCG